jgi:hypothetical protein
MAATMSILSIGSEYYWGASFWFRNGWDGDCDGDLDVLKARVLQQLKRGVS